MKCCQEKCDKEATHYVFWPGQDKKEMCEEDSKRAIAISMALGFNLYVEKKDKE